MNSNASRIPAMSRLLVLSVVFSLTGCFSLARTEPLTRHYLLGASVPQEATASAPAPEGPAIGIRRLRLAAYLEPPLLAVRRNPGEVGYSEYHRWAEPLGDGINRTVAGHLAARNAFRTVAVAPWAARMDYDYAVQLKVEHFEGVAAGAGASTAGEAHVRIAWEIARQEDGAVVARGTTDHREAGWEVDDYAALVRFLDSGVSALAAELGRALEELATRPTTFTSEG